MEQHYFFFKVFKGIRAPTFPVISQRHFVQHHLCSSAGPRRSPSPSRRGRGSSAWREPEGCCRCGGGSAACSFIPCSPPASLTSPHSSGTTTALCLAEGSCARPAGSRTGGSPGGRRARAEPEGSASGRSGKMEMSEIFPGRIGCVKTGLLRRQLRPDLGTPARLRGVPGERGACAPGLRTTREGEGDYWNCTCLPWDECVRQTVTGAQSIHARKSRGIHPRVEKDLAGITVDSFALFSRVLGV